MILKFYNINHFCILQYTSFIFVKISLKGSEDIRIT